MLSTKVKQAKKGEMLNYLNDIKETAVGMEETDHPEVRAFQSESINFRIDKIETLIKELI